MPAPKKTNSSFSKTFGSPKPTPKPTAKPTTKPTAKKSSNKDFTAQNIGKAIAGAVGATAAIIPVGRGIQAVRLAKAAKATAKANQLARNSKLAAQQKATTVRKADMGSLEKQIKAAEAQIKANSQRVAELAKKPRSPGGPDRTSSILMPIKN